MLISNSEPIDPDRRAYLTSKYVTNPPPGPVALAEQLAKAMQDMRSEAEAWNTAQDCAWLNWQVPPCLRAVADRRLVRVREAMARESRGGGHYVHWYDDRNKFDELVTEDHPWAWVPFDPDAPHMQCSVFGHILSDTKRTGSVTVHVLRGGTEPLLDPRDHLGSHERPVDSEPPNAGMIDWGDGYGFVTFMAHADYTRMLRFCTAALPGGCRKGIGGGDTTLVAIPMGRDVFAMHICEDCLTFAEAELTADRVNRGDY